MEIDGRHDEMKEFIEKTGLVFDDEQDERRFVGIVVEELELRIGRSISSQCTQKEIEEYETLLDMQEKKEWLEKYVPQYKIIVRRHIIKIKSEIRDYKNYIIEEKNRRVTKN